MEAAFVTFNNEESASRCVEDYRDSSSWLGRRFQAPPLRFKGQYPLTVIQAPEPTDILWENVCITDTQRRIRQAFVYCVMVVILCMSVTATVTVGSAAAAFAPAGPDSHQCRSDFPAIAYGNTTYPADAVLRYNTSVSAARCPVGTYNLDFYSSSEKATAVSSTGKAPFGTCVSPANTTLLWTPVNSTGTATSNSSRSYAAGGIVQCLCYQEWEAAAGFLNGFLAVRTPLLKPLCGDFAVSALLFQVLSSLKSVMVVIINMSLSASLRKVTRMERHLCISDELHHMSLKLFVAQFVNTALLVQVVNMQAPEVLPSWMQSVMRGSASLWSVDWYSTTGAAIVTTMTFQVMQIAIVPSIIRVIKTVLSVSKARKAVTQAQMNQCYEPQTFLMAARVAQLLNIVFVTFTYSAPLPILLPIATANICLMFWYDKVSGGLLCCRCRLRERRAVPSQLSVDAQPSCLHSCTALLQISLLKWYKKPPRMTNALVKIILQLVPYAVVLHLLVAFWTFGQADVMPSPTQVFGDATFTTIYQQWMDSYHSTGLDVFNIAPRASRVLVFPAIFMFFMLFVAWFMRTAGGKWFLGIFQRAVWLATGGRHCTPRNLRVQKARPQFSGPYVVQLPVGSTSKVEIMKARDGWRIRKDPTREYGNYVEIKVWMSNGKKLGVRHHKGQTKLTWQVIQDSSIHSYSIFANPTYNVAASVLYQAHKAVSCSMPFCGQALTRKAVVCQMVLTPAAR